MGFNTASLYFYSWFMLCSSCWCSQIADLGWKRLPNSVAIPVGGTAAGSICNDPTEWSSSVQPVGRTRRPSNGGASPDSSDYGQDTTPRSSRSLYPSPHAWTVCFFNDRSGHFCNVSIITLAINIAIRAEGLAKMFGIVNDPDLFSNIHQRNTSATLPGEGPPPAEESKGQPDLHQRVRYPIVDCVRGYRSILFFAEHETCKKNMLCSVSRLSGSLCIFCCRCRSHSRCVTV